MRALDVSTFKVDERRLIDLISFATAFSELISYHGEDGGTATWDRFFIGDLDRLIPGDVSFLIAKIANADAQREYSELVGLDGQVSDDQALLNAIYDALKRLDYWSQSLSLAKSGKDDGSVEQILWETLESLIAGDYGFGTSNLPELVYYLKHAADSDVKARWSQLIAIKGELGGIWAEAAVKAGPASAQHDPLHIYGLINRTTRVMSAQAAKHLEASLKQSDHAPHAALLLAFLMLYSRVQDDLNQMTGRHLNFYFRTILRLAERASKPDKAHVYFELAPEAAPFTLNRGTLLSGGADAAGAPILFELDDDLDLDHARIAATASLYIRRLQDKGQIYAILARPVANSQDGFGAKLADPGAGWSAFGVEDEALPVSAASEADAQIGLLIRSPCLLLRAGTRHLTVTLQFAPEMPLETNIRRYIAAVRSELTGSVAQGLPDEQILAAAFCLALEGTAHDRQIDADVVLSHLSVGQLIFRVSLGPDAPPIAPAPPAVGSTSTAPTGLPALRITLKPADQARVFAYSFFEGLALKSVLLDVSVKGVAPLTLQTSTGLIDASKPFLPFGPFAPCGANLIFSHPDLLGKTIEMLTMRWQWTNLPAPPDSFESIYAAYDASLKSESFRGSLSALCNYAWVPLAPISSLADGDASFPLFDADLDGIRPVVSQSFAIVGVSLNTPLDPPRPQYDQSSKAGFFRLQLTSPSLGFGQQIYPQLLMNTMLANARAGRFGRLSPVPNPPIAPMIAAFSIDYTAHAELPGVNSTPNRDPAGSEGIFRFGPFGMRTDTLNGLAFPALPENGYLLVGIDGLGPSASLTLLFHIDASAADFYVSARDKTEAAGAETGLKLRYFSGGDWKDIPRAAMTQDTTEALSRSGILHLRFPADTSPYPSPIAGDLTWLQISVNRPEHYGRIIDIRCQAVTATRRSPLAPNINAPMLPPDMINALVQKNAKVLRIGQPFATEGGCLAEDERQFHIRVSERLRHKQRAILPHDYEALILDRFPSIGDAKCLTRSEAKLFGAGVGEVVIVVAPLRVGAADSEPRVPEYMLRDIGAYLLDKTPASVRNIIVRNPEYERIRISVELNFISGDRAAFLHRVRQTVNHFIAPWREDVTAPLAIGGGELDLAAFRAALENLSFIDEASALSIVQLYCDPKPQKPNARGQADFFRICDTARPGFEQIKFTPWWPWSVLTPAPDHQFKLAGGPEGIDILSVENDFVVAFDAGDFYKPPEKAGIGDLEVGVDFLVQAGIDRLAIEDDFGVG